MEWNRLETLRSDCASGLCCLSVRGLLSLTLTTWGRLWVVDVRIVLDHGLCVSVLWYSAPLDYRRVSQLVLIHLRYGCV